MPSSTGFMAAAYRSVHKSVNSIILDASDPLSLFDGEGQPIGDGSTVGLWKDTTTANGDTPGRRLRPNGAMAPMYDATRKCVSFRNEAMLSAAYVDSCPGLLGNSFYCVFSQESNSISGAAGMCTKSPLLSGPPYATSISSSIILGTTMQCIADFAGPDGLVRVPGRFATSPVGRFVERSSVPVGINHTPNGTSALSRAWGSTPAG